MQAITCEVCGSNSLTKQGDFFVCDFCGTKYSLADVRALLGVVQIDRSNELVNILKNADGAFADGNHSEAHSLYSQALSIDPENPRAIVMRAVSSAWGSSVKDCKLSEINGASQRGFKIAHDKYGDTKEYFDFCYNICFSIAPVLNAISQMYITYYNKAMPSTGLSITAAIATSGIAADVQHTLNQGTLDVCFVAKNIVENIMQHVSDYTDAPSDFFKSMSILIDNCISYRNNANMPYDGQYNKKKMEIDRISLNAQESLRKRNAEAYWAEHADEKVALEQEYAELRKQVEELDAQVSAASGEETLKKLEDQRNALNEKYYSLGMFKAKEKKQVEQQLENVRNEIRTLKDSINKAQSDIRQHIYPLTARMREIENELRKGR